MKKLIAILTLSVSLFSGSVLSAGPKLDLDAANNDIMDIESLKRGAVLFANKCMSCHGVKYMRYNRVAADLGWTDEEALKAMGKTRNKPVDNMMGGMAPAVAKAAFGTEVPDLSLITRLKGTDYVYTFIQGWEKDPETGKLDNKLLKGTVMPNIFPKPADESKHEKYEQDVRDISNFLEYAGEPAKLERLSLAPYVLAFLFVLLILSFLLKKEYWRDVH